MSIPRISCAFLLASAAVAAATAGCATAQKAFNDLTSNHYYRQDSYRFDGPYGSFEHKEEPNQATMTLGMGYGKKVLTDKDCDMTVDVIEFKDERYVRGQAGSERLFEQADKEWAYCFEKMHVAEVDAKWREMTTTDVAHRGGYWRYKY